MSKSASNVSTSNSHGYGTFGSLIRGNKRIECFCQDESVLRTVNDVNSVNKGRKFWGCKNYINHIKKVVIFSSGLVMSLLMEKDLKLERQKKKINKLKNEVIYTRWWLKMSIVVGIVTLGLNLVFVTMYLN
ncbi:unnamed protein product [Lathyrus sativus]|nr:unnamed protein product [Lathyrus sativus]